MFCPECGTRLPDDSVFCENCGAKLAPVKKASPAPKKVPKKNKPRLPVWSVVAAAGIAAAAIALIVSHGKEGGNGTGLPTGTVTAAQSSSAKTETAAWDSESVIPEGENEPVTEDTTAAEPAQDSQGEPSAVSALSTDENADATDFEWFLDLELGDGTGAGTVVTADAERVAGEDFFLLGGGWKAYMSDTASKPYAPETERYFNVTLDTDGSAFTAVTNWNMLYFTGDGASVTEEGSDRFEGTWDVSSGTASVRSDYGMIEFDAFYIAGDYSAEYATGTFYWISGEVERIALMRTED